MVAKVFILFCAQALLAHYISGQCIGAYNAFSLEGIAPWRLAPWTALPYTKEVPVSPAAWSIPLSASEGSGLSLGSLTASNGGGFSIVSSSPIIPTGLSMTSENAYEGPVVVSGSVPFLGALALEGILPTAGVGGVSYGCGDGNVVMTSEDVTPAYVPFVSEWGYGYPGLGYEAAIPGPAYGYGYNKGCGCGVY